MPQAADPQGQLRRIDSIDRPRVLCTVDGESVEALEGDTVMTMLLLRGRALRRFEFGGERRAGFCLIGVCQDCWVHRADGTPLRACTTLIELGMALVTRGAEDA